VVLVPTWNSKQPINCLNVSILSTAALSCILPTADLSRLSSLSTLFWQTVQVFYSNGKSTNYLSLVMVYNYPDNPQISAVSGCGLTSTLATNLSLSSCSQGAILTLTGINLNVSAADGAIVIRTLSLNAVPVWFCQLLTSSYTTITCQIPPVTENVQLRTNLQYGVVITATNTSLYFYSNAFYVTLTSAAPNPPTDTSNSSNNDVVIIATTTVIIGLLLVLLGIGIWWYRPSIFRKPGRLSAEKNVASQSMSSSLSGDVELFDA